MKMKKTACHMLLALASLSPLSSALAAEPAFPSFGAIPGGNLYILDPEEPVDVVYVGSYYHYGFDVEANVIDSGGRLGMIWKTITFNTKYLRQGDTRRLSYHDTKYGGEVIIRIKPSSAYHFYSGDRNRNADNYVHAKVVYNYAGPGTALVGFEAQLKGGDRDYNDAVFLLTNVTRQQPLYQPSGSGNIGSVMPSWPK
ncbi:MAG: DUF4114 domain-containing protein [Azoarcus sp.]|jgi:hypothetical protein|nr:DUF4114 domain-containing protein [Azoarcus sp.]